MSEYTPTTEEEVLQKVIYKSLTSSWRNMHTNMSGGFQDMLADYAAYAIMPVIAEIKAQVWDDCAQEAYDRGMLHDINFEDIKALNPHRQGEEQ